MSLKDILQRVEGGVLSEKGHGLKGCLGGSWFEGVFGGVMV